jgi:predicted nucleic acid-binding Zn ribbon protein
MEPHLLANVLKKYVHSKPLGESLLKIEVLDQWDKICPPVIAKHARPVGFKDKKLSLAVNSSAWLNELTFFKEDLITALNRKAGKEVIKEIRFYLKEG